MTYRPTHAPHYTNRRGISTNLTKTTRDRYKVALTRTQNRYQFYLVPFDNQPIRLLSH